MDLRNVSRATPEMGSLPKSEEAKLRRVSQEFESILLNYLFKGMRQTISESGGLPKAAGHDLYQQLFTEEISRSLARSRGAGIGDLIYKELKRSAVSHQPSGGR